MGLEGLLSATQHRTAAKCSHNKVTIKPAVTLPLPPVSCPHTHTHRSYPSFHFFKCTQISVANLRQVRIIHHILLVTAFHLAWMILHPGTVTRARRRRVALRLWGCSTASPHTHFYTTEVCDCVIQEVREVGSGCFTMLRDESLSQAEMLEWTWLLLPKFSLKHLGIHTFSSLIEKENEMQPALWLENALHSYNSMK